MPEPQFDPTKPFTEAPPFDPSGAFTAAAPAKSTGHDFKLFGVNIHVPAEQAPRPDSNMIGWGSNGAGVAPEDMLAVGQVGRGVVAAARGGGALAGVKEAVVNTAPLVKYEIAKGALEHLGVPSAIAMPIAMAFSGYKKGAKVPAAAAEAEAVSTAGYPRAGTTSAPAAAAGPPPVAPGASMPGYPRGGASAPTPAPAAAPAAAPVVDEFTAARTARQPTNAYPDQVALNREALEARRAAYRASQGAPAAAPVAEPVAAAPPPGPVVKESGKMRFTKEEMTKFLTYRKQGIPLAKAEQRVMLERELAAKPGFVSEADMKAAIAARGYKS